MTKRTLFQMLSLIALLSMALSACAPAAAPAPTQAPAQPPAAQATTAPAAPAATPTVPPPNCAKMDGMPTVAAGALGSAEKPIVMTFVPSGDVPTITKAGTEIADCLSQITGLTYKIEVGTSFAASIEAMGAGKAQIGFLNTFSILLAQSKYGIEPALVALRTYKGKLENFYQGQFIASKASGIKTLADLKGKTFCFVEPNSTSGYIIPRIVLKANGIDPDKDFKATQNAGSHDNVAIAVYKGDCDAGSTFVDVRTDSNPIKESYPDILDKVDQLYVTDNIPNDGMQFIKDLDQTIKDTTVKGLLFIAGDTGGKAMLRNLYSYRGLAKIEPTFYDAFRGLMTKAGVDPAQLVK
ncbi:MAG: phosphate/phosphite/phosphonate ABC transporter substrate-binding protein [Chloroflexi bacterium]|nr:phosphate/phosphite/phosphonate ABC transporter substrate-binding protein [Chloroflexota bacterium]